MLCVIAKLDSVSTDRLACLQKIACSGMVEKPLYGHITVAAYIGEDELYFIQSCKKLLKVIPAFTIVYEKIEVLDETSIIVATPKKSETLSSLHHVIAAKHKDVLDKWTGSENWYPHTTLYHDPHLDLQSICLRMTELFRPFTATISRIEFSRVLDNRYEIIEHMDL
ncbi:MAG: 2'-5' RNA ligase family protein [Oscillospiraceae bacterium]|nr:2'-5' RNA ligase family protein [Oscillospiraceae bacterium]